MEKNDEDPKILVKLLWIQVLKINYYKYLVKKLETKCWLIKLELTVIKIGLFKIVKWMVKLPFGISFWGVSGLKKLYCSISKKCSRRHLCWSNSPKGAPSPTPLESVRQRPLQCPRIIIEHKDLLLGNHSLWHNYMIIHLVNWSGAECGVFNVVTGDKILFWNVRSRSSEPFVRPGRNYTSK